MFSYSIERLHVRGARYRPPFLVKTLDKSLVGFIVQYPHGWLELHASEFNLKFGPENQFVLDLSQITEIGDSNNFRFYDLTQLVRNRERLTSIEFLNALTAERAAFNMIEGSESKFIFDLGRDGTIEYSLVDIPRFWSEGRRLFRIEHLADHFTVE